MDEEERDLDVLRLKNADRSVTGAANEFVYQNGKMYSRRQIRACEPDATIEERIGFDACGIVLWGKNHEESTIYCDPGNEEDDIARVLLYLVERFNEGEWPALQSYCDHGVEGWPRTTLRAALSGFRLVNTHAWIIRRARADGPEVLDRLLKQKAGEVS